MTAAPFGIICAANWVLYVLHDIPRWPDKSDLVDVSAQLQAMEGGAANASCNLVTMGALPSHPDGPDRAGRRGRQDHHALHAGRAVSGRSRWNFGITDLVTRMTKTFARMLWHHHNLDLGFAALSRIPADSDRYTLLWDEAARTRNRAVVTSGSISSFWDLVPTK